LITVSLFRNVLRALAAGVKSTRYETPRNLKVLYIGNFILRMAFGMVILALPLWVPSKTPVPDWFPGGFSNISGLLAVAIIAVPYPAMEMVTANYFGIESDKVGRKKIIVFGCTLAGISVFLYALTSNIWFLAGVHAVHGVGAAATVAPSVALIADDAAVRDRGRQMGAFDYSTFTGYISGIVITGVLIHVLPENYGLRGCFIFAGVALFGSALMLRTYIVEREIPEDVLSRKKELSHWDELVKALKNPKIGQIIPIWLIMATLLGLGITYLPRILIESGQTALEVSLLIGGAGFVLFLLQPFWGKVSDEIGRLPVMVWGVFSIGGILVLLVFFLDEITDFKIPYLAALGILGLGAGAFIPAALAYLADSSAEEDYGVTMGLYSFTIGFGFFIAEAVGLLLIWYFGDKEGVSALLSFAGGLIALAVLLMVISFFLRRGDEKS